jgi:tRNA(Ile)-lysidine synthase
VSGPERPPILTDEGLTHLFAPLVGASGALAAVSGGPDSIALMHLLARWIAAAGRPPVSVATVDHGLRAESAEEAAFVAHEAAALGLPHKILAWAGRKPSSRLQEAARQARYDLLFEEAGRIGASHVLTAHTRDDQAETVLMRLSAGSGITGLGGMRCIVFRGDVLLVRPLLAVSKADLIGLCAAQGWEFLEDPSNTDPRFARVRWRNLMPDLAREGLTAVRLARLAARAARADAALDAKAKEAFARARLEAEAHSLRIQGAVLAAEPFEIALRVLGLALDKSRSATGPSRLDRLESCTDRLRRSLGEGKPLRTTLAGALILLDRDGNLCIAREKPRRRGRYRSVRDDAADPPHSLGKGGRHA